MRAPGRAHASIVSTSLGIIGRWIAIPPMPRSVSALAARHTLSWCWGVGNVALVAGLTYEVERDPITVNCFDVPVDAVVRRVEQAHDDHHANGARPVEHLADRLRRTDPPSCSVQDLSRSRLAHS
jgi:hypothetical protein